ncbi:MAG: NAD(P)/FAD-dependent oxidoreductase [Chloroflexota bacterium]
MEERPRVAVLGAGALGLVAAYRLLKIGYPTTVIEREGNLGGLAAGFPVGDTYLDRFYHHIFRTDREAVALIAELGLGGDLLWLRPKTSILHSGRQYQLDSPFSVLRFSPLSMVDRLRMGMAVAYLKVLRDHRPLEKHTADSWLRRYMGGPAYEAVWRPQLAAKFGDRYADISMAWFWARVHDRTSSLGYLRGGFQALYDRLGEEIRRLGGELQLGETVTGLAQLPDGAIAVGTARGQERFARVLSTLPTRVTLHLAQGMPADFRQKYEWGEAYGAQCVILALDRKLMLDNTYWLSVTEPGYPFMAVVEHTNMMPVAEYGGRHLVYLGNYLPMDDPLFSLPEADLLALFLPHLKRLNPAFDPTWVHEHWVFRAPYAQPIVTRDFPLHIAPLHSPWPNLWLASMFHVYPHDRGQNYSIALGNEVAKMVAAGASELPDRPARTAISVTPR